MERVEHPSLWLCKQFTIDGRSDVSWWHAVEFREVIDCPVDFHILFQHLDCVVYFAHRARVILQTLDVILKDFNKIGFDIHDRKIL